jgi:metal-responsive CopG/Arc/MetJ family transcriptional regulator
MKQPTIHISFDAEDLDLFNKINQISSSKHINKSGLVRDLIRKSISDYEKSGSY